MFQTFVDRISKCERTRLTVCLHNQNTAHHFYSNTTFDFFLKQTHTAPSLCSPSRFHFSHKDPIKLLRPKVDACALGSVCSSIIIIVNGGMEVWAWGRVEMGWGWVAEGGGIFGVQSQERLDGARK